MPPLYYKNAIKEKLKPLEKKTKIIVFKFYSGMKVQNYNFNIPKTQAARAFSQSLQKFQNFNNSPLNTSNFDILRCYPANYYFDALAFGARVDKGLERFYDVNKDIMPKTMRDYIDNTPVEQRKNLTPIMAQRKAFEELVLAENVDEVKELYPNEPLFEKLKSVDETRATEGLLYEIKVMKKDLENEGSSVLSTGEDLTLYLLGKIFLENKTLNEINKDLDTDLNPVFKKENGKYIGYSTFSSLGIKLPKHEYLTSLYHTKEGYSDYVGGRISKGQAAFWAGLSDEEKLERRKNSLAKLENWWRGLSDADKMELLEKKDSEIKLLKEYKKSQKNAPNPKKADNEANKAPDTLKEDKNAADKPQSAPKRKEEKLETSLSGDEIFIEWARKNLEIFELSLSDEQRAELNQKRAEAQLSRWQNLSSEEKTALIEKMQSGQINQKMAMIDAWNNCSEIREHLSSFMKENNLHGEFGLMYRDSAFSEAQSRIMTSFWEKYPDDAAKLGDEIRASYTKIKKSIDDNTFDGLKIEILNKQASIKKAKKQKKKDPNKAIKEAQALKKAQEDFVQYYHRMYYFLPKDFLDSYCDFAVENLKDARALSLWANMNNGKINMDEVNYVTDKIAPIKDTPRMFMKKRAMEQAMAEVLYEASNKDEAALKLFGADFKDLQNLMLSIETHIIFPVGISGTNMQITKRPDYSKLEKLYRKYDKPVSKSVFQYYVDFYIKKLIETNSVAAGDIATLKKYVSEFENFMMKYGDSAQCVFANSKCPGNREAAKKLSRLFDKEWMAKS